MGCNYIPPPMKGGCSGSFKGLRYSDTVFINRSISTYRMVKFDSEEYQVNKGFSYNFELRQTDIVNEEVQKIQSKIVSVNRANQCNELEIKEIALNILYKLIEK